MSKFEVIVLVGRQARRPPSPERFRQGGRSLCRDPATWPTAAAADRGRGDSTCCSSPTSGWTPSPTRWPSREWHRCRCATWGHPVTTGSPTMDYFLSSELLETRGRRRPLHREARAAPESRHVLLPSASCAGPRKSRPTSGSERRGTSLPLSADAVQVPPGVRRRLGRHLASRSGRRAGAYRRSHQELDAAVAGALRARDARVVRPNSLAPPRQTTTFCNCWRWPT